MLLISFFFSYFSHLTRFYLLWLTGTIAKVNCCSSPCGRRGQEGLISFMHSTVFPECLVCRLLLNADLMPGNVFRSVEGGEGNSEGENHPLAASGACPFLSWARDWICNPRMCPSALLSSARPTEPHRSRLLPVVLSQTSLWGRVNHKPLRLFG